jgi:hypothetical protein
VHVQFVQEISPFLSGWVDQLFRKHAELPQVLAKIKYSEPAGQVSDMEHRFRLIREASERNSMLTHYVAPSLSSPANQPVQMTEANKKTACRNRIDFAYVSDDSFHHRHADCITLSFPTDPSVCHWLVASDKERERDANFCFSTCFVSESTRATYDHITHVTLETSTTVKAPQYVHGLGIVPATAAELDAEEFILTINYAKISVPLRLTTVINDKKQQHEDETPNEEEKQVNKDLNKKRKKAAGHKVSAVTSAKRARTAAAEAQRRAERDLEYCRVMYPLKTGPYDLDSGRFYYDPAWKAWTEVTPDQVDSARRALIDQLLNRLQRNGVLAFTLGCDVNQNAWVPERPRSGAPYQHDKETKAETYAERRERALNAMCRRGKHTITAVVFQGLVAIERFHPMFVVVCNLAFARLDAAAERWAERRSIAAASATTTTAPVAPAAAVALAFALSASS